MQSWYVVVFMHIKLPWLFSKICYIVFWSNKYFAILIYICWIYILEGFWVLLWTTEGCFSRNNYSKWYCRCLIRLFCVYILWIVLLLLGIENSQQIIMCYLKCLTKTIHPKHATPNDLLTPLVTVNKSGDCELYSVWKHQSTVVV